MTINDPEKIEWQVVVFCAGYNRRFAWRGRLQEKQELLEVFKNKTEKRKQRVG